MNAATVLLLLITNQGFWFGGEEGTIEVRWAIDDHLPDAVLIWELNFGTTRISKGRVGLRADREPSTIKLTLPKVRTVTRMTWVYRVESADGEKVADGAAQLNVFPPGLLKDHERWRSREIAVIGDKLAQALAKNEVKHKAIESVRGLQFARTDIVLIAPDALATAADQASALAIAESGASVLIFAQNKADNLMSYPLTSRPVRGTLVWRAEHPLLAGLSGEGWQSLFADGQREPRAIGLPADEPALDIVAWPREAEGEQPVPIDALVAVKAVGRGRMALCQLPLKDWQTDPRSQLFLRNALDYLATRPEPTPPPSQRDAAKDKMNKDPAKKAGEPLPAGHQP